MLEDIFKELLVILVISILGLIIRMFCHKKELLKNWSLLEKRIVELKYNSIIVKYQKNSLDKLIENFYIIKSNNFLNDKEKIEKIKELLKEADNLEINALKYYNQSM